MTQEDIALAMMPIMLTVMGYLIYRNPQDIVNLIRANQTRCDFEMNELMSRINALTERTERDSKKILITHKPQPFSRGDMT